MRIVFFLTVFIFGHSFFAGVADAQSRRAVKIDRTDSAPRNLEAEARLVSREWNLPAIEKAVKLYESAAALYAKENAPQRAAACLREAARLNFIAGEEEKSAALLDRALKILRGAERWEEESRIYSDLSLLELDGGEKGKSKAYFEKALLLAARAESPAARAAALYSAGEFYYFDNNGERDSLAAYKESVELWRQADDAAGEARSLLSLGYLRLKLGEYAAASEALDSALGKSRAASDARGQALALKASGIMHNVMSRKQASLDRLFEAEKMFPEDADQTEKASLYNSIGHVYEDYGEWRLSLKYRLLAYRQFQKANHLQGQMATLPSLGKLSYLSGDDAAAAQYFRQAEELAGRLKSSFFAAIVALESGDFHFYKGEQEKALGRYLTAHGFFQTNTDRAFVARVSVRLGRIYENRKQMPAARRFYADALEKSREISDRFAEAETLFRLAHLDETENRETDALVSIEASIALTEHLTADILNSKVKSTYFSNIYERYELYISLLMKMHARFPERGFDRTAFQASEKSRSRSMLEKLVLTESDFSKDADPEIAGREREIRSLLNLKFDELTNLLNRSADAAQIEKARGEINEMTTELEDLRAALKQNSPVYSAVRNLPRVDPAEIQRIVLDEETVFAEFSFGRKESFLWLVEKNRFASYRLPARERLERRIEKLRGLLGERQLLPGETGETYHGRLAAAEQEYRLEARALSDELFGQVGERLKGKRLIVVADGKLHYFPIAALPQPDSDEPFLLGGETIYEPAAATLLLQVKSKRRIEEHARKSLAIFSDPIFSADDARVTGEDKDEASFLRTMTSRFRQTESLEFLPRLPATREEAADAVEIVGSRQSADFSGFSASRAAVLSPEVSGYKIIHFATHGLIDEERPELSGIVLSLFDEKGARQEGLVRIHDIYGLNLSSDLIVLSACSTGIGKEVKGEGLQSLTNGFLQAGSKSVVSSLWKVDDYATRDLMREFYRAMVEENASPAAALRQAQIKLRENPQYRSPFYWAAFTVQGDYRRPLDLKSGSEYSPLLLTALAPILLIVGYGIYRLRRAQRTVNE